MPSFGTVHGADAVPTEGAPCAMERFGFDPDGGALRHIELPRGLQALVGEPGEAPSAPVQHVGAPPMDALAIFRPFATITRTDQKSTGAFHPCEGRKGAVNGLHPILFFAGATEEPVDD